MSILADVLTNQHAHFMVVMLHLLCTRNNQSECFFYRTYATSCTRPIQSHCMSYGSYVSPFRHINQSHCFFIKVLLWLTLKNVLTNHNSFLYNLCSLWSCTGFTQSDSFFYGSYKVISVLADVLANQNAYFMVVMLHRPLHTYKPVTMLFYTNFATSVLSPVLINQIATFMVVIK